MIKVAFKTLGCKVNTYETNYMRDTLPHNFIEVDFNDKADVYIINTCSVTHIADKKSRQMINRSKNLNPNSIVVSLGCFSDNLNNNNDLLKPNADLYILNKDKNKIWDIIKKKVKDENTGCIKPYNQKYIVRGFLKVEDGCENFCSYCIIPYLRGKVNIRDKYEVLSDARLMAKKGIKEIVITGINITACGKKYLLDIMREIAKIENIYRIRLGSIEQSLIDDDFLYTIKNDKYIKDKFCEEFHLSLQSGSNDILKYMNRHYTKELYKNKVDMIRKYFSDASITTDIIVGFSGETIDNFNETLEFIKDIRFYAPHIFPYSKRYGTRSYDFKDEVNNSEKMRRVKILTDIAQNITKEINDFDIKNNKRYDVLIEEVKISRDKYILIGHTKNYRKVYVPIDKNTLDFSKICKKYVGHEILVDITCDVLL